MSSTKRTRTPSVTSKHSKKPKKERSPGCMDVKPSTIAVPKRKDTGGSHDSGIDMEYTPSNAEPLPEDKPPSQPQSQAQSQVVNCSVQNRNDPAVHRGSYVPPPERPSVAHDPMERSKIHPITSVVPDGHQTGLSDLARDWERARIPLETDWFKDAMLMQYKEYESRKHEAEMRRRMQWQTSGYGFKYPTGVLNHANAGQYRGDVRTLDQYKGAGCDDQANPGPRITIEDPHFVTLPRTMENQEDQKYDTFVEGVTLHSNGLRYHVRTLDRSDVGTDEFRHNSRNVWHRRQ